MGEVLKIFISATSGDLGEVRRAAREFLNRHPNYKPIEQEHFGPAPEALMEMDERKLEECDLVLHIVGLRYGHEAPPGAGPRRSYTQAEYDTALELKKPLYLFYCEDHFPFTPCVPESEDRRALQQAHRAAVLAGHHQYKRLATMADFEAKIRELYEDYTQLLAKLKDAEVAQLYDREKIRISLEWAIRHRAGEERARLDPVRDWEAIAELEQTRDQQLADIDRFLEQVATAFDRREANENYTIASRLLAERGVAEALRFLESKSGATDAKIAHLKRAQAAHEQALRELLREKLFAASLLEKELKWEKAEAAYRKIICDGGAWVEPRHRLVRLLCDCGTVMDPTAGNPKLREAVELCYGALHANLRETDSRSWADTQICLGIALSTQSTRAHGPESLRLFGQTCTAYRAALEVYTQAELPQAWAMAQNNLGNALQEQGTRAEGAESLRLLGDAVMAYRAALEVYTQAHFPDGWAMTQNNLGAALAVQGRRVDGADSLRLLAEAVIAYRAALERYARDQSPLDWAMTQTNFANALLEQGTRAEGTKCLGLLAEAVAANRAALEVRTREHFPQAWAMTTNNLGTALRELGMRAKGMESHRLLSEAVTAHRSALEVYTRERLPQGWALTQNNLGNALWNQGNCAEGAERQQLLGEAVTAYRAALEVYTREQLPQDWAMTQNNLGNALWSQGKRAEEAEGQRLVREAVVAYRAALEVYTQEHLHYHWKRTQENLSLTLRALANRSEAAEAARLGLEVQRIEEELATP